MKERAREMTIEARRGADNADEESVVLAKIAEMPEPDRSMAKRLHVINKASVRALSPKTWYGMPAYAKLYASRLLVSYPSLFAAERDHWIDSRRATRRNVRGNESCGHQHRQRGRNRRRIGGGDAEQHRRHDTHRAPSSWNAKQRTEDEHPRRVAQDQSQDLCALRSESQTNANLTRASGHGISQEAIEPDRGKQQCEGTEDSRQPSHQPLLSETSLQLSRERSDTESHARKLRLQLRADR